MNRLARHIRPGWRVNLFLGLILGLLLPCALFGAGTPAGTVISSQATVSFVYGTDPLPRRVVSNTVSIKVAQVAAVNLTPASGSSTARINTVVNYPFSLVNSGNGTDKFSLSWVSSLGLTGQIYVDANNDQILSSAELAAGPVGQSADILEDRSANFVLSLLVPDSVSLSGQTDVLVLTAISQFDASKRASITRSTPIQAAMLVLQMKVNRVTPRAGDRVMYVLELANPGNLSATNISLTDVLDPRMRYVTGSAVPYPDSASSQRLFWTNLSLPPKGLGDFKFEVDILNNVPPGTEIHNAVVGEFQDGPNHRSVSSTEQNFMTIQGAGYTTVDIRSDTTAAGQPGDTLQYAFVVSNNGAMPEEFNLSSASTQGLIWTYYGDASGSGRVEAGATPITTTGVLEGGARCPIVARTVLPVVPSDQTLDVTTFTVRSAINQANAKSAKGSTVINVPKLSLAKVATAPEPLAGSEIMYTITYSNAGHGAAYGFAVTDSIPVNTAYIPGSTTVDGAAKTDAADGDEVMVNGGIVTVNLGTVEPSRTGTIVFRVKIL